MSYSPPESLLEASLVVLDEYPGRVFGLTPTELIFGLQMTFGDSWGLNDAKIWKALKVLEDRGLIFYNFRARRWHLKKKRH